MRDIIFNSSSPFSRCGGRALEVDILADGLSRTKNLDKVLNFLAKHLLHVGILNFVKTANFSAVHVGVLFEGFTYEFPLLPRDFFMSLLAIEFNFLGLVVVTKFGSIKYPLIEILTGSV